MLKKVNDIFYNFSNWYRNDFRLKNKDETVLKMLEETMFLLKDIKDKPNALLNLKAINCPHCDSIVYLDKDKELEKCGLVENFYCPYCGRKAIE